MQDELDALATLLGHGVTVDAPDGRLLGYSRADDADAARVTAILRRGTTPEVRAWEERHRPTDPAAPFVVPPNDELGFGPRYAVPLVHGGVLLGRLMVLSPDGEPGPTARAAIEAARPRLTRLLVRDRHRAAAPPTPAEADRALADLLDGQDAALAALRAALPHGGAGGASGDGGAGGAGSSLVALAVESAAAARVPSRWRQQSGVVATATGAGPSDPVGLIALVLPRGGATVDSSLLHHLDQRIGAAEVPAAIGVSSPAEVTAGGIRTAVRQASTALRAALADPGMRRPAHWAALGVYRTLADAPPDPLAQAALAPLADSPALLETLEVYLDLGGDARATASRVNLHRTSLYYRLERIATLLGVDLADGRTRLDLHLALKARRLHGRS